MHSVKNELFLVYQRNNIEKCKRQKHHNKGGKKAATYSKSNIAVLRENGRNKYKNVI